jgi:hypothetical protein
LAQFGISDAHLEGVIPKAGAFQPTEGSPAAHSVEAGDPFDKLRAGSSLRLKNGCAQDDDVDGQRCHPNKLSDNPHSTDVDVSLPRSL